MSDMARYIDAEKLVERLKVSPVFKDFKTDGYFIRDMVIDLVECQQIADVAPIAEVERLTIELEAMRGAANSYQMHYKNLAREIFEEIEKLHLHVTNEFDLRRYNELKKKYTED